MTLAGYHMQVALAEDSRGTAHAVWFRRSTEVSPMQSCISLHPGKQGGLEQ